MPNYPTTIPAEQQESDDQRQMAAFQALALKNALFDPTGATTPSDTPQPPTTPEPIDHDAMASFQQDALIKANAAAFTPSRDDASTSVLQSMQDFQRQALAKAQQSAASTGATAQDIGRKATSAVQDVAQGASTDKQALIDYARQVAQNAGIDPDIFVKQINQESGFNPKAGSDEGAQGIAQFMPSTAKGMGVDPWNPYDALKGAARFMVGLLGQNGGDYRKALAAYNAGQGNVDRYGEDIFNPAALLKAGWKAEDAYQPSNYINAILGKTVPLPMGSGASSEVTPSASPAAAVAASGAPPTALPYNVLAGARSDSPASMASYMPGLSPALAKPTEPFVAPTQNGLLPGSLADLDEQTRQAQIQAGMYRPPTPGQPLDFGGELQRIIEAQGKRAQPGVGPFGPTIVNPNLVPPTANEAFEQGTEAIGHLPAGGFLKQIVGLPGFAANAAAGAVSPQQPGESSADWQTRVAASLEKGAAAGAVVGGVGHAFGGEGVAPPEVAASDAEVLWQNIRHIASQVGFPLKGEDGLAARDAFIQKGLDSFEWMHGPGTPEEAAAREDLYRATARLTAQDVLNHIDNALYEAQAAKEGRAEVVDPQLKVAYDRLWKPNPGAQGGGDFKTDITLNQWTKWGYLAPAENAITVKRGVRYVKPDYVFDQVASNLTRPFEAQNQVQRAESVGISVEQMRSQMLQYERDLKAGVSEGGNVQTLKEQKANVETILRQAGGEVPGAAAPPNGAAAGGANGSANGGGGTTAGAPPAGSGSGPGGGGKLPFEQAARQFLAQSKGTPEEQSQIAGKIARDPENEKQVLLHAFPESVRPYLQDIAGEYGEAFAGRRRGVITDVQAAQNAVAAAAGMSVQDLMKTKAGTAFNQEQILALGNTVTMLGDKVKDLAQNKQSYSAAGRWTAAMEADRVKAALQLGVTASLFRGGQAEAGRALRAFQSAMNGEQSISMRAIARATERFGIGSKDFAPQTEPGVSPGVGGQRQSPPEGFRGTAEVQIPPGESAKQLPHQENLPGTFPPHPAPDAPSVSWDRWQTDLKARLPGIDVPPRPASTAPPEEWSRWESSYQEKLTGFNPPGSTATEPAVPNEAELARQRAETMQQGATSGLGNQAGISPAVTQKRLDNAYKAIGTNAQKFADWVSAWQQTAPDDYVGRYKLLQALGKPDLLNMAAAIRMSNLLANTKTGMLIGTHGLIMAMNRPFIRFVRESPSEGMADFLAQSKAIGVAFGNAVDAFTEGIGPAKAGEMLQRGAIDVPPEVFPGKLGMVLTPGTRFSAGVHELQQTLSTAGAEATIARRIARDSGRTVEDVIANPPPDMLKQMQDYADKYSTIDPITQWFLKGKGLMNSEVPAERALGALINFFLPFVKYPGFVISNGAKITAAPVYYPAMAVRHALLGEGEKAIGDLRMGMFASTVLGIIIAEAAAGNVTGSGPQNAGQRAALEQARDPKTGQPIWQANSVRVPTPGGGYRWVDNKLMGVLTVPLSVVGAAAEAYRFGEVKDQPTEKVVSNVAGSVLKSMLDASYLKQVAQIITSIQQGQGTGVASATVTGLGGFVPYSSALAEVDRVTNPEAKAPGGVAQEIASRIPVLSGSVPNRITPYGQEARNPQDVVSMAVPANTSVAGPVNLVANEVARLQAAGESVAPKVFTSAEQSGGGAYLGSPQSGEQIRNLQQAMGQNAQRYLENAMNAPGYAALSDARKAATLRDALATANAQAETQAAGSGNVALDDQQKAILAWKQTPHYRGVDGTPEQIAEQNLEIEKSRGALAKYEQAIDPRRPATGRDQFRADHPDEYTLARTPPLNKRWLDGEKSAIDDQYNGALTKANEQGLIDTYNAVLPLTGG